MLHPQAQALLDLIQQRGVPPTHTLSPTDARTLYRDRRSFTQPEAPPIGALHDLLAQGPHGTIPVRLYRPVGSHDQAPLPVLAFFHGGGWVIGDLDTHDTLCRELCNGAGCAVVSVDYRLAPEHRFPAAFDDALAATRWIHANADELHLDAARLAVGGDSAGGNLAAAVALAARDAADLPIAYQLLIYPATDQHRNARSHTTNGQGYMLTADTMAYFTGHYLGSEAEGGPALYDDWRCSPLLAKDLARLPPALVLTAGFDPLRDEGAAYAERLTAAGNHATHVCFEREIHGFILMGKVLDEANAAVGLCATELKRVFGA